MKEHKIGVIMNGVSGRMGTNQHLIRSILAIRAQGGVCLDSGDTVMPDPILVGRNPGKIKALAQAHGLKRTSTDLDACLSDPDNRIYFDAQRTDLRKEPVLRAIAAGKHIYTEKPPALNTEEAMEMYRAAVKAGVKNGVVQDKLWLPGLLKLKYLKDNGFFGRILSVRCEFGYWVFDGIDQPSQRPSWNYRKEDGGGIILDMFCHWRYVIDNLFAPVKSLSCIATTHIDRRVDENGREYPCTAEDAAYATFLCRGEEGDLICHFNSSWVVRVRRDDLVAFQVEGTRGTAVAGLRDCWLQPSALTPRPIWNPDLPQPIDFYQHWQKLPDNREYENAFKVQWELFLKHVVADEPFPWTLLEGAKGVQLAEAGMRSWAERRWVDLEELEGVKP
jgi:predicted dehydrogenase